MKENSPTYEELLNENLFFKQKHKLIEETESLETTLIEAISDAVFLIDKEGTFLKYFPAKDFKTCIPPEVFFGKNMRDIFPVELSSKFFNCVNLLFNSKKSQSLEYSLLIDGENFYYKASLVLSKNGNILSVIHDITEQKQIQNKLNNERLQLKTLIETIPDLIWLKDNSGVYLACNNKFERFFGAKEFQGTGIGLANIKKIIKKHGGTIYAEGEVDKGATFYLSL